MGHGLELYYKPWTVFWLMQSLGLAMFVLGMAGKLKIYFQAGKKSLYKSPNISLMIKAFLRDIVLQKQLAEKNYVRWFAHMFVFYGFLGLFFLSAVAVFLKIVPEGSAFSVFMLDGQGHNLYKAAGDLFGLLVLLGLVLACIRRFIVRDRQLDTDSGDVIILGLLLALVITGFLAEGMRIALSPPLPGLPYSFVGYNLAGLFLGLNGLGSAASLVWVVHGFLNAVLFAYFPHSKFMHIFSSPIEVVINASEEELRSDLYT